MSEMRLFVVEVDRLVEKETGHEWEERGDGLVKEELPSAEAFRWALSSESERRNRM